MDDAGFSNAFGGAIQMRVLMVGPVEEVGGVATHTRYLVKELRKAGIDVKIYSTSPKKNYPSFIANIIKLYKKTLGLAIKLLLTGKKFDIIHLQISGPMGGFLPALVYATLRKFKLVSNRVIITFHYSGYAQFIKEKKNLLKFVLNYTDGFIVVSENQKKAIMANLPNVASEKIFVIPNGFDPSRLRPMPKNLAREKLNLKLDTKIIFNLANLLEKKGHKYLILAMKQVVSKCPNIVCYIGGEGPEKEKLNTLIKELNLENHVKLLGFVPDEKLALWMNAADLFVLSSLSEGNPTVMFEALGVGLPFLGTKVGGVPEIIISEDYGLLCEPANPKELAEKILIALEKEWDREKIRKYAEQFTWENVAKKTLEVYRGVLK